MPPFAITEIRVSEMFAEAFGQTLGETLGAMLGETIGETRMCVSNDVRNAGSVN